MSYILHRHTGDVLFTSKHDSVVYTVEKAVRTGVCLDYADLSHAILRNACFAGASLAYADFTGADLTGANLSGACLWSTCFTNAKLADTNLSSAQLRFANFLDTAFAHTDLRDANLSDARLNPSYFISVRLLGANLCEALLDSRFLPYGFDVINAGPDSRGFRFIAVRQRDCCYRIHAGCRWLTPEKAAEHWRYRHDLSLRREILAKLDLIAKVAEVRGWMRAS